jgi:hypothetical protein
MGRLKSSGAVVHAVFAGVLALTSNTGCHGADDADEEGPSLVVGAPGPPLGAFQRDLARNPDGIALDVRLLSRTSVFHQGERIPIELRFPEVLPEGYVLDRVVNEGTSRLEKEAYRVTPAAAVSDPLADYANGGFLHQRPYCGISGDEARGPFVFDLNEWVRFMEPGDYELEVQSSRVGHVREPSGDDSVILDAVKVTSNTVALRILPEDPAWSSRALEDATQAFDDADAAHDVMAREGAARVLRFLDTKEAARAMAARFTGGEDDPDLMYGLASSPYRREAVVALEESLDAPLFPVTAGFLETLARLFALARAERITPEPSDPLGRLLWSAALKEIMDAESTAKAGYTEHLAAHVADKKGAARATSVVTLLEIAWEAKQRGDDVPAWYERVSTMLPEVFADLSEASQFTLLDRRWRKLTSPTMLPALRRILSNPSANADVRGVALQGLRDLAPDEGRARIVAALGAPTLPLCFPFPALAALPDATLPELDDALAERFERCMRAPCGEIPALGATLLSRYATASVADRVWSAWAAKRDVGGDALGPVLAFFARVDPARATELGESALARARAGEDPEAPSALTTAARLLRSPSAAIEPLLLQALDDDDPRIAERAASALGHSGSPAALPRLWRRLERFHAVWQGRGAELRGRSVSPERRFDAWLEAALARAIVYGSAWLSDAGMFERLEALLVTDSEKAGLRTVRTDWAADRLPLRMSREGFALSIELAHYSFDSFDAFRAKLAQFPRGTRFAWLPGDLLPGDEEAVFALAASRDAKLERQATR